MNKKKKITITAAIVTIVLIAAVLAGYFFLRGKLALKNQVQRLLTETYSYTLDYQIEGIDTDFDEGKLKGTITGTKGDSIIYGALSTENVNMIDFYVGPDGKILFNARPVFENILSDLGDIPIVGQLTNLISVDDFYFSTEQIAEITGNEPVTLNDAGVNESLFEAVGGNKGAMKAAFSIKEKKNLPENEKLLGDEAYYFEIVLQSYNSSILIGVPKDSSKNEISLAVTQDDISWIFHGNYQITDDVVTELPEESLSDDQIEVLKKIYSYWQELKK